VCLLGSDIIYSIVVVDERQGEFRILAAHRARCSAAHLRH
jgi:hypothetical protein